MKYKVGDKVKIREDLVALDYYGDIFFVEEMNEYKGKIAIITSEDSDNRYSIDIDKNNEFTWSGEMFEDVWYDTEKTVDIGYYLKYCGYRVIQNVYYGGYAHDHDHVFCTTADSKNQYTLPVDSIEFIIPHED